MITYFVFKVWREETRSFYDKLDLLVNIIFTIVLILFLPIFLLIDIIILPLELICLIIGRNDK